MMATVAVTDASLDPRFPTVSAKQALDSRELKIKHNLVFRGLMPAMHFLDHGL